MKLLIKNLFTIFILTIFINKSYSRVISEIQDYDENFLIKHLTTNTPYVKGDTNVHVDIPKQCKLVSIDLVARHGNRMPTLSSIEGMNTLKKEITPFANELNSKFKWILNYTVPFTSEFAGNLIEKGEFEHYGIGKRLYQSYRNYFKKLKYTPQSYNITATQVSRVGISAQSFTFGLFEGRGQLGLSRFQPVSITTESLNQEKLMRFFSICKKYKEHSKQPIAIIEQTIWNNLMFPNISTQVSHRLGLSGKWLPSNDFLLHVYAACSYEMAIENNYKSWCSLLSKQNILDFEYSLDLFQYWVKSYGNPLNFEIASVLLKDVISKFDCYTNKTQITKPMVNLRFGHAETTMPYLALLGLYKDDQFLFANSTHDQIKNRKFKTSEMSTYANNIGMFLYDCGNGEFKIETKHNESPLLIPGCDGLLCNFNTFKSIYKEAMTFDFDSYCNNDVCLPTKKK